MDNDIAKLEAALKEKNFAAAKQLIDHVAKSEMSETEKGDVLIGIASAYMDIVNTANEEYLEALKEIVQGLEKINSAEKRTGDKIKIAEVRQELNSIAK